MTISKKALIKGAMIAAFAASVLATTSASAAGTTYVVCNKWDECWRVHEHYTFYPSDVAVTWHSDAWWAKHEHDSHWRELPDPSDEHGWYDKDGNWHAYAHD